MKKAALGTKRRQDMNDNLKFLQLIKRSLSGITLKTNCDKWNTNVKQSNFSCSKERGDHWIILLEKKLAKFSRTHTSDLPLRFPAQRRKWRFPRERSWSMRMTTVSGASPKLRRRCALGRSRPDTAREANHSTPFSSY